MKSDRQALRIALAGMLGMAVAMGIGRFVFTPFLPAMMDEIPLSASTAGLIASANYLGYLVGALLAAGMWAAGRERGMALAALFASAILAGTMGLVANVVAFAAIRFLAGVASALAMIFLSTIVLGRVAAAGREALGTLNFAGVGLGIGVSALMLGLLLAIGASWQTGWFWASVVSLAGALAVLALARDVGRDGATARREPPLLWTPAFRATVLAYGLFGVGYVVTATFLIAIVRSGGEVRALEAWVWLVTGLAIIPSVWLWSLLAGRIGQARAFALGCLVEAFGVVASVTLGGLWGPLAGGLLLGGTFIAVTYLGLQMARRIAVEAPRRALSAMTAAFGTGQIVGPLIAGYAADWTGDYVLGSLGAAAALLAAAAIGWRVGEG